MLHTPPSLHQGVCLREVGLHALRAAGSLATEGSCHAIAPKDFKLKSSCAYLHKEGGRERMENEVFKLSREEVSLRKLLGTAVGKKRSE